MINKFIEWIFKSASCKVGYHDYLKETVIDENRKVTLRLQCQHCPHHTSGWTFPRQAKLRSFR